jgi:hypothetical protein
MNILITTLSLGYNYTKDYCLRMIEDVLSMTDIDIYITTDFSNLIYDKFGKNDRIKINEINRDDLKIRIPIGPNKGADDFNFNMRYLCLEHVSNIQDSVVIFTDCDNSFDWWDKEEVIKFIELNEQNGFDFFGPRTDYKLIDVFKVFNTNCAMNPLIHNLDYDKCTIMWHKLFNYDLVDMNTYTVIDFENHIWKDSPLPAEYLLIFNNKNNKLYKMVEKWKWFHDYLVNKDYSFGTWAEGFEIGVSANYAGFKPKDITFTHPLWNKIFTPNGYKTGPRGGVVHGTEK